MRVLLFLFLVLFSFFCRGASQGFSLGLTDGNGAANSGFSLGLTPPAEEVEEEEEDTSSSSSSLSSLGTTNALGDGTAPTSSAAGEEMATTTFLETTNGPRGGTTAPPNAAEEEADTTSERSPMFQLTGQTQERPPTFQSLDQFSELTLPTEKPRYQFNLGLVPRTRPPIFNFKLDFTLDPQFTIPPDELPRTTNQRDWLPDLTWLVDSWMENAGYNASSSDPMLKTIRVYLDELNYCTAKATIRAVLGPEPEEGATTRDPFDFVLTLPPTRKPGFDLKLETSGFFLEPIIRLCMFQSESKLLASLACRRKGLICQQEITWANRVIQKIVTARKQDPAKKIFSHQSWEEGFYKDPLVEAMNLQRRLMETDIRVMPKLDPPGMAWVTAVVFYGLAALAALLAIVVGLLLNFFRDRKMFFALVVLVCAAASLQASQWALSVSGYAWNNDERVIVVNMVRLASEMIYLAILTLFSVVMLRAMREAFDLSKALPIFAGLCFLSVSFLASVYAIIMAVITTAYATHFFVPDYSFIVLPAVALSLCVCMTLILFVMWRRLVKMDADESTRMSQMRSRNALAFLAAALLISAIYVVRVMLAALAYWVDAGKFLHSFNSIDCVALMFTTVAVLAYVFAALYGARRRKIIVAPQEEGYALWDSSKGLTSARLIPEQYDV